MYQPVSPIAQFDTKLQITRFIVPGDNGRSIEVATTLLPDLPERVHAWKSIATALMPIQINDNLRRTTIIQLGDSKNALFGYHLAWSHSVTVAETSLKLFQELLAQDGNLQISDNQIIDYYFAALLHDLVYTGFFIQECYPYPAKPENLMNGWNRNHPQGFPIYQEQSSEVPARSMYESGVSPEAMSALMAGNLMARRPDLFSWEDIASVYNIIVGGTYVVKSMDGSLVTPGLKLAMDRFLQSPNTSKSKIELFKLLAISCADTMKILSKDVEEAFIEAVRFGFEKMVTHPLSGAPEDFLTNLAQFESLDLSQQTVVTLWFRFSLLDHLEKQLNFAEDRIATLSRHLEILKEASPEIADVISAHYYDHETFTKNISALIKELQSADSMAKILELLHKKGIIIRQQSSTTLNLGT